MIKGIAGSPARAALHDRNAAPASAGRLSFQNRLIDSALNSDRSLNGKHAVIYMDCLVSQTTGNSQELAKNPAADLRHLQLEQYLSFQQQEQKTAQNISPAQTKLTENQKNVLDMIKLLGVKLKNQINWDSDGSGKLTDEQIRDLQERYDVTNLSRQEYYNLLTELVNLNVISGDDFEKQFIRQASPEVAEYGYMLIAAFPDNSETAYRNYLKKFLKDAEMFEYYFRVIEEGKSSIHASNIIKIQTYYNEEKKRCERFSTILKQIQRQENTVQTAQQPKEVFHGLDILGPSAPDEVKAAWNRAEKESGMNGYGIDKSGKLAQLTLLFVMSMENAIKGCGQDILGNTADSAKAAVQRALDRLGIPQDDKEKREKLFYEAFLAQLW